MSVLSDKLNLIWYGEFDTPCTTYDLTTQTNITAVYQANDNMWVTYRRDVPSPFSTLECGHAYVIELEDNTEVDISGVTASPYATDSSDERLFFVKGAMGCNVTKTAWSNCDNECGPGIKTRTITILKRDVAGGVPCPDEPITTEEDECIGTLCATTTETHVFDCCPDSPKISTTGELSTTTAVNGISTSKFEPDGSLCLLNVEATEKGRPVPVVYTVYIEGTDISGTVIDAREPITDYSCIYQTRDGQCYGGEIVSIVEEASYILRKI